MRRRKLCSEHSPTGLPAVRPLPMLQDIPCTACQLSSEVCRPGAPCPQCAQRAQHTTSAFMPFRRGASGGASGAASGAPTAASPAGPSDQDKSTQVTRLPKPQTLSPNPQTRRALLLKGLLAPCVRGSTKLCENRGTSVTCWAEHPGDETSGVPCPVHIWQIAGTSFAQPCSAACPAAGCPGSHISKLLAACRC